MLRLLHLIYEFSAKGEILREAKKLSRTDLAKLSGIRYQKIRDIEVGIIKPENIALKTAVKLAAALGCDPAELMRPDKEDG